MKRPSNLKKYSSENFKQVSEQEIQYGKKSQTLNNYNGTIETYSHDYNRLTELREEYQKVEKKIVDGKNDLVDLQNKKSTVLKEAGLSAKQEKLFDTDLKKHKKVQFRTFLILLTIAIAAFASALFISLYLAIVAAAALVLSILSLRKYQQADNLFTKTAEVRSIAKQVEEKTEFINSWTHQIQDLTSTHNFITSRDIDAALNNIANEIEGRTGIDNLQSLIAVRDSVDSEVTNLNKQDILTKKK